MRDTFYFTPDAANPNNLRVHGKTGGQICKVYGWDPEIARVKTQHVVDALNAYDTRFRLTPSELAHLIRLLGGPLEGAPEFRATDVLALREKLEAIR